MLVAAKLALDVKEMRIRVADRDIRIKRLQTWIAHLNDTGLTEL
jgi:hypothetical protein